MSTTPVDMRVALSSLAQACTFLRYSGSDVELVLAHLSGVRAERATELSQMIVDALAYAHRLSVCVEGDLRCETNGGQK